jgi:hypothetical protein
MKIYKVSHINLLVITIAISAMCIANFHLAALAFGNNNTDDGWFFICLGGAIFPFAVYQLWNYNNFRHDLILRDSGISYEVLTRQIGTNFVPWSEMERATLEKISKNNPAIVVKLKESEFSKKLNIKKGTKILFGNAFFITSNIISGHPVTICNDINDQIHNNNGH